MERLINHLQQVATHHDLAQLHQWLCTYMVYVQSGTPPTAEIVPYDPRAPLLYGLRWKGLHLLVPDRALQEIPARPLALLAVRGYLEAMENRAGAPLPPSTRASSCADIPPTSIIR